MTFTLPPLVTLLGIVLGSLLAGGVTLSCAGALGLADTRGCQLIAALRWPLAITATLATGAFLTAVS